MFVGGGLWAALFGGVGAGFLGFANKMVVFANKTLIFANKSGISRIKSKIREYCNKSHFVLPPKLFKKSMFCGLW